MPRLQPFGASLGLAIVSLGTALGAASSCSSATPEPTTELPPASSAARAEARRQREMRQEALDELQGRPKKKAKTAPPPKATATATAAPPPAPSGEGGGGGEGGGTGGGGGEGGGEAAADEPVDLSALCDEICARALSCARETMPPELQGSAGPMLEAMSASCGARCQEEAAKADAKDIAEGKACLEQDCEDFMSCVSDLM